MNTDTSPSSAEIICHLEEQLPERLRHWLADARANSESVGDAGGTLIEALRTRFQWTDDDACALVNQLLEAYGEEQRYHSRSEMRSMRQHG